MISAVRWPPAPSVPGDKDGLLRDVAKALVGRTLQVDHNDKENRALLEFNDLWQRSFSKDSLLVFSTGRSHALYEELRVRRLHPVVLQQR